MNEIRIPEKITEDIAYLAGFISGDGHLCLRQEKHEYSVFCTGNLNDEKSFYEKTVKQLFFKIFKIIPKTRIDKKSNTINLVVYSKNLLFYFSDNCKIPIGAKSGKVEIPRKFEQDQSLKKSFIQGFVDADFSLCLKKRYRKIPYYPVISGTSKSKTIILQIAKFLQSSNISYSLNLDKVQHDTRFKNEVVVHSVYIYGYENLNKWMNAIGFRNTKYLKILKKVDSGARI